MKINSLFKSTLVYGISSIIPRFMMFFINPILINLVSSIEYSEFSQLYSLAAFINILLTFGFETSFYRYVSGKTSNLNYSKVLSTSFWFILINSFLVLLLSFVFIDNISHILKYDNKHIYIYIFSIIIFFDNISVILMSDIRYQNNYYRYLFINLIKNIIYILSVFLLLNNVFISLYNPILCIFISNMISSMTGVLLLYKQILKIKFIFCRITLYKLFSYGIPIMLAGIFYIFNENFDKFIQRYYIEYSYAGSYSACYKISTIMVLAISAYRLGAEPYFFKIRNNKDNILVYNKTMYYFVIFCTILSLFISSNTDLIKLIFIPNSTYWISLNIVPIILISNLFYGIYYNLSVWYKIVDKTYIGTIISFIGAVITILSNVFFLKKYGFIVSAWSTLISYFLMMVISYILSLKYSNIRYNIWPIIIFIFICFIFSYILFRRYIIGNIISILFTIIVIIIEKNKKKIDENKNY